MLSASLLSHTAVQKRPSAIIGTGVAPVTIPLTVTWSKPVFISLDGTAVAASSITITITGSLNGNAQSEVLSISSGAPVTKRSLKQWTAVTSIVMSGTGGGTVTIRSRYGSGQDAEALTTITSSLKGRLVVDQQDQLEDVPQGVVVAPRVFFYANALVQLSDILEIDGARYEVVDCLSMRGQAGVHHYRTSLRRLDKTT